MGYNSAFKGLIESDNTDNRQCKESHCSKKCEDVGSFEIFNCDLKLHGRFRLN
jgi:hypothetical protein